MKVFPAVVSVLVLLGSSDAWAIKVIGRSQPAPAEQPPLKAPKPAKVAKPEKPPKRESTAAKPTKPVQPDDTLKAGQVCALSKPLKAKVKKKDKTLAAASEVTIRSLVKGDAVLTTTLGEARVKRAALAEVCEVPPPPPPPPVAIVAKPAEPDPIVPLAPPPPKPAPLLEKPVAKVEPKPEPPRVIKTPEPIAPVHDIQVDVQAQQRAQRMRVAAWTLTGLGVAGLGAGVALFVINRGNGARLSDTINSYNASAVRLQGDFDAITRQRAQVQLFDTLTLVAGGVGLASLATGVVLFAAGDNPNKYDAKTSTRVSFIPGPGSVSLSGAF